LQIANRGIKSAAETLKPIARAINIADGKITNQAVAATFGMLWDKRFEAHPTGL
jgi:alanine dehydrogenase